MIGPRSILKLIGVVFYNDWVLTLMVLAVLCYAFIKGFGRPVIMIALYFSFSIINPQSFLPLFSSVPLIKIISLMALLSIIMNTGQVKFRFPFLLFLFMLFLVWSFISYTHAGNMEVAGKRFWEFNKIFLISYLCVSVLIDRASFDFLSDAVLYSFYFLILKTLTETQTKGHWYAVHGPGGWIGDSNDWGLAIAMFLPFAYIQIIKTNQLKIQLFHIFAAISTMLALTFTSSRGAFLSAMAGCLVLLVTEKKKIRAALAGVVMGIFVLMYMPESYVGQIRSIFVGAEQFDSAWEGDNESGEYSGAERAWNWNLASQMMNDYPWTGVGWGNYVLKKYQYDINADPTVAHSTWFQVGAEAGKSGLICYCLLLIGTFGSLFRTWLFARRSKDEWVLRHVRMIGAGLAAFCVGATFISREYSDLLFCYICMAAALSALKYISVVSSPKKEF